MSFVNSAAFLQHTRTDKRLLDQGYDGVFAVPVLLDVYTASETIFGLDNGYTSPWWPLCAPMGCLNDAGLGDVPIATTWGSQYPVSGANGRLGFVGTTRDQYGSPLGNCTVRCIRVSTNELTAVVVSDANGAFIATSPYNDAHFLVVHGTGVAGATVDTLIPS